MIYHIIIHGQKKCYIYNWVYYKLSDCDGSEHEGGASKGEMEVVMDIFDDFGLSGSDVERSLNENGVNFLRNFEARIQHLSCHAHVISVINSLGKASDGDDSDTENSDDERDRQNDATMNTVKNIESKFTLIKQINDGGNAKIILAKNKNTNKMVVLKQFDKDFDGTLDAFKNKCKILNGLNHRNIIEYYGGYIDDHYYISSKYLNGGKLLDYVKLNGGKLSGLEARKYIKQILKATHYLYCKHIVHRNLTLRHIMFDKDPKINRNVRIVLIDFSKAQEIENDDIHLLAQPRKYVK